MYTIESYLQKVEKEVNEFMDLVEKRLRAEAIESGRDRSFGYDIDQEQYTIERDILVDDIFRQLNLEIVKGNIIDVEDGSYEEDLMKEAIDYGSFKVSI